MNVLLLNPPGTRPFVRDYYCSKVSKADYLYHPTDLLMLSGIVASRHAVTVLDALAEKLSVSECLKRVRLQMPEVVISLCGAVSWEEDKVFLRRLKAALPSARIVVSGDLFLGGPRGHSFEDFGIDALLLDFTSEAILDYIERGHGEAIESLIYRHGGQWIEAPNSRPVDKEFEIPRPLHELFLDTCYRFPFVRRKNFATVLTDYGCMHKCSFCVMGSLGYKRRSVESVLDELAWLNGKGVREIYFNDQTFGLNRDRAVALLQAMVDRGYRFGWVCWSRVDRVDSDLLRLMKKAGCHTVMFGAESGDDSILAATGKGFLRQRVEEVLQTCRGLGLRTVATFLLGLPGQDKASCLRTIAFARQCGCDFASFNIAVPRMRTGLRQQAIEEGWVGSDDLVFDQSGTMPAMGNGILSARDLYHLLKKAKRDFYLRPAHLLRLMASVRSLEEFRALVRFGIATFR